MAENATLPNPRPIGEIEKVSGRFDGAPALPNRRITGGTVRLTIRPTNISNRKGFRRTAEHEVGHALGLAHPNSTIQNPAGDPTKRVGYGGTVMNSLNGQDDSQNSVADRPTRCDIKAVELALRR